MEYKWTKVWRGEWPYLSVPDRDVPSIKYEVMLPEWAIDRILSALDSEVRFAKADEHRKELGAKAKEARFEAWANFWRKRIDS